MGNARSFSVSVPEGLEAEWPIYLLGLCCLPLEICIHYMCTTTASIQVEGGMELRYLGTVRENGLLG